MSLSAILAHLASTVRQDPQPSPDTAPKVTHALEEPILQHQLEPLVLLITQLLTTARAPSVTTALTVLPTLESVPLVLTKTLRVHTSARLVTNTSTATWLVSQRPPATVTQASTVLLAPPSLSPMITLWVLSAVRVTTAPTDSNSSALAAHTPPWKASRFATTALPASTVTKLTARSTQWSAQQATTALNQLRTLTFALSARTLKPT